MDTHSDEGGTARLGQLCACYFGFYAVFGVLAKGFTTPTVGFPAMNDVEFLAYSTLGGNLICLAVLIAFPGIACRRRATSSSGGSASPTNSSTSSRRASAWPWRT